MIRSTLVPNHTKTKPSPVAAKTFQSHRTVETLRHHPLRSDHVVNTRNRSVAKWRRLVRNRNVVHRQWIANAQHHLPVISANVRSHITHAPIQITFTSDETLVVSNCPIRHVTHAIKSHLWMRCPVAVAVVLRLHSHLQVQATPKIRCSVDQALQRPTTAVLRHRRTLAIIPRPHRR